MEKMRKLLSLTHHLRKTNNTQGKVIKGRRTVTENINLPNDVPQDRFSRTFSNPRSAFGETLFPNGSPSIFSESVKPSV
jgi:hypothetical protein